MVPVKYTIKDRGATPRGMRKAMNASTKQSWFDAGLFFHDQLRDKRFTHAHATKAGYADRSRNYERRKLKQKGHTNPLQYSGTTRRAIRTASITSTSKTASVRYPGARVFNFRNPKSQANMVVEFTTVLADEANQIAQVFDKSLDRKLNEYIGVN
jgi:hypothetical protein